jgi:hypothetical protein
MKKDYNSGLLTKPVINKINFKHTDRYLIITVNLLIQNK